MKRLDKIREILMRDWDPCGINDVPECADEYDRYAISIDKRQHPTFDEIFEYLIWVEEVMMLNKRLNKDRIRLIAQSVHELFVPSHAAV